MYNLNLVLVYTYGIIWSERRRRLKIINDGILLSRRIKCMVETEVAV